MVNNYLVSLLLKLDCSRIPFMWVEAAKLAYIEAQNLSETASLPPYDHRLWRLLASEPGGAVIVSRILEIHRDRDSSAAFNFATEFLRLFADGEPKAFGHAASNVIKPCKNKDLDHLAMSIITLRSGVLSEILKIQNKYYCALLTTGISIIGQMIKKEADKSGEDPATIFEKEFVAHFTDLH